MMHGMDDDARDEDGWMMMDAWMYTWIIEIHNGFQTVLDHCTWWSFFFSRGAAAPRTPCSGLPPQTPPGETPGPPPTFALFDSPPLSVPGYDIMSTSAVGKAAKSV